MSLRFATAATAAPYCELCPHPVSPTERWLGEGAIVRRVGTRFPHLPFLPPLPPLSAPSLSLLSPPAGAPLARRSLSSNSLTGSLPTQLGGLTALTSM